MLLETEAKTFTNCSIELEQVSCASSEISCHVTIFAHAYKL